MGIFSSIIDPPSPPDQASPASSGVFSSVVAQPPTPVVPAPIVNNQSSIENPKTRAKDTQDLAILSYAPIGLADLHLPGLKSDLDAMRPANTGGSDPRMAEQFRRFDSLQGLDGASPEDVFRDAEMQSVAKRILVVKPGQEELGASVGQVAPEDVATMESYLIDRRNRAGDNADLSPNGYQGAAHLPLWAIQFALQGGIHRLDSEQARQALSATVNDYAATPAGREILKTAGWDGKPETLFGDRPYQGANWVDGRAQSMVVRFGKQLWNKGVADTIKSSIAGLVELPYKLQFPDVVNEEHTPAWLAPPTEAPMTSLAHEAAKGIEQKTAETVPAFNVPPATNLSDKLTDVGAGLAAFIAQLAVTKRILPVGTPDTVIWEAQNLANGGTPGMGAALCVTLGVVGKTPLPKWAQTAVTSGIFGGLEAAQGGDATDIMIQAGIPVAFHGMGYLGSKIKPGPIVERARMEAANAQAIPPETPVGPTGETPAPLPSRPEVVSEKGLSDGEVQGQTPATPVTESGAGPAPPVPAPSTTRMSFTTEPGKSGSVWSEALAAAEAEGQAKLQVKVRDLLLNRKPAELRQIAKDIGITQKRGEGLAIPLSEALAERSQTSPPSVLAGETHPGSWTYQQFMERYGRELAADSPWVKRYSLDRAEKARDMYKRLQDEYRTLKAHQVLADLFVNDKSWKAPELMTEGQRDRRLSEVNAAIQATSQYQERIASLQAMPLPHSTFYVDPKYKGEVESVIGKPGQPGYNFRVGQYITYSMPKDRKTVMHWEDTAQQMGMPDLSFDKFLEYLDAATQRGSVTKVSQNVLDDLLAWSAKDPYLSGLAMHRDMLQRGFSHNEIREAVTRDLTGDAEYYGLTAADIPDIVKAVLLETPREQTSGRIPQAVAAAEGPTQSDLAGGEPAIETGDFADFTPEETRQIESDASDAAKVKELHDFFGVEPPKDVTPEMVEPTAEHIGVLKNLLDRLGIKDKTGKVHYEAKDLNDAVKYIQLCDDMVRTFPQSKMVYEVQLARERANHQLAEALNERARPYFELKKRDLKIVNAALSEWERTPGQPIRIGHLTPEQRAAFDSVREGTEHVGGLIAAKMRAKAQARADRMRSQGAASDAVASFLADSEIKVQEFLGHIERYLPHKWYGKYVVVVRSNPTPEQRAQGVMSHTEFQTATDRSGRFAEERRLQALFPESKVFSQKRNKNPYEVYQDAPMWGVAKMMDIVIEDVAKRLPPGSPIPEMLREEAMKEYKSKGAGAFFINRKNIPGYTTDFKRPLAEYFAGISGYLSKMDAMEGFAEGLQKIDQRATPKLYQYWTDYVRYVTGEPPSYAKLKEFFYLWHILASVKTATMNGTQNWMTGWPVLSTIVKEQGLHWSLPRMLMAMERTAMDNLRPNERKFLKALDDAGIIASPQSAEVSGRGGNPLMSQLRGYGGQVMDFVDWMQKVERWNRQSMAIALHGAGLDSLDPENLKRVGEIIDEAHFHYGKGNRPLLFRGIASPLLTFKTWNVNYMTLLKNQLKNQQYGAFTRSMVASAALTGAVGLPASSAINWIYRKTLGRDLGKDASDLVGYLAEALGIKGQGKKKVVGVVMRGLPSLLNISTESAGAGDVLPTSVQDLWGIPGDWVRRAVLLNHDLGVKNYSKALEDVSPAWLRNPLRAYREYQYGVTNSRGQALKDYLTNEPLKLTGKEALGQALGFQSNRVTEHWSMSDYLKWVQDHMASLRSNWTDRYYLAWQHEDPAEMDKVQQEVAKYNDKMEMNNTPEQRIRWKDIHEGVQAMKKPLGVPKQLRPLAEQTAETYSSK